MTENATQREAENVLHFADGVMGIVLHREAAGITNQTRADLDKAITDVRTLLASPWFRDREAVRAEHAAEIQRKDDVIAEMRRQLTSLIQQNDRLRGASR